MILLRKRSTAPVALLLAAAAPVAAALVSEPAVAHGVIGQRFFPATISTDDPFAADELALPTITSFDHETDVDFDFSKSIFPGFAIGIGIGHVDAKSPGEPRENGFGNLDISPALEVYHNPDHEFILTTGLDWEVGGTGSKTVAERSNLAKDSAISPMA
jgi:hypothetical protein